METISLFGATKHRFSTQLKKTSPRNLFHRETFVTDAARRPTFRRGSPLVLQGLPATTMVGAMQVLATYRFTVGEYHRLGEAGILGEDDRVELLNGDLITMAPIGGEHRTLVDTLTLLFARLTENDRYRIGIQNPVSLDPYSEPQLDSPRFQLRRQGLQIFENATVLSHFLRFTAAGIYL